jgi:hypothetical protein
MSFRSQEISFFNGIKDFISDLFTSNIKHRRVEVLVFQVLIGVLWWILLSVFQRSFNVLNWPIHFRLLLNIGWGYLFIMLFLGMFVSTITVRSLLDYLFFPLEFLINLLITIFKNWLAQLVDDFFHWFIHFIWNNIITKILLIGMTIIVLTILITGITVGGILLLGLFLAIALATLIAIGYGYYKHYEGDVKKIINDLLCSIRKIFKNIRSIPSAFIDTLKFFILDQMKTISDDERVQALLFQLTLVFLSYVALVYITGIYDPNMWSVIFSVPWMVFIGLQVLFVIFIWWPNGTYSFKRMLTFFFKPLYWLVLPIEIILGWIENLIPCEKQLVQRTGLN